MGSAILSDIIFLRIDKFNKFKLDRYLGLDIEVSLKLPYRYHVVCQELSYILIGAFKKLPKDVQSLVFQHTLSAFRLLPVMETQSAFSAANALVQSAEAVLPNEMKVVAVKEFKLAKIRRRWHYKIKREEGLLPQLPQDVLLHIFTFLDSRSLISASSVCWAWNLAAKDNYLWSMLYTSCFGLVANIEARTDWRRNFRDKYKGGVEEKLLCADRAFCGQCEAIVWVSNMKCPKIHRLSYCRYKQVKPLSPEQIVEYVLGHTFLYM